MKNQIRFSFFFFCRRRFQSTVFFWLARPWMASGLIIVMLISVSSLDNRTWSFESKQWIICNRYKNVSEAVVSTVRFVNSYRGEEYTSSSSSIYSIVYPLGFLHCPPPPPLQCFPSYFYCHLLHFSYSQFHIFQTFRTSNFLNIFPFPVFQIFILPIFLIFYFSKFPYF